MGLDMSLNRIKSFTENNSVDFENQGEEIKYWRKYYSLHTWFYSNCKRLNDDIIDGYVVTIDNLNELLFESKKQLSGDINIDFDLTEETEYLNDLILFLEELITNNEDFKYYYEWFD